MAKTLFIPAYSRKTLDKTKFSKIAKKLPKKLAIAYSIQYKKLAEQIKNSLSLTHEITKFIQVLGCSKPKFPKNTKAILLISNGKFHAVSLSKESKLPVYLLDNNNFSLINEKEIKKLEQKRKTSYLKFLYAEKIGILISTKYGQQRLKKALTLKNKLKQKKKYFFIANEINIKEFENFPHIQSWINSACPRIDMNSLNILNMGDLINSH